MAILAVKNLYKSYGKVEAVKGISFEIEEGKCFGLLGPNGAGKSTTLEIIEGVRKPSSGEILFKGEKMTKELKSKLGVQFQTTALQDHMTVKEAILTFSAFYENTMSMDELVELCQLQDILNKNHKKLSGGQRQRLLLALAILNEPEIVLLDEPTTGLDPQSRKLFWNLINKIKSQNKTIILTTHYMEEAYQLCDELIIVDHGKIIARGTPKELLKKHFKGVKINLQISKSMVPKELNVKIVEESDSINILTENLNECVAKLLEHKIDLSSMEIQKYSLEDLFILLTGSELREN